MLFCDFKTSPCQVTQQHLPCAVAAQHEHSSRFSNQVCSHCNGRSKQGLLSNQLSVKQHMCTLQSIASQAAVNRLRQLHLSVIKAVF
jgi:hypothetical protein